MINSIVIVKRDQPMPEGDWSDTWDVFRSVAGAKRSAKAEFDGYNCDGQAYDIAVCYAYMGDDDKPRFRLAYKKT